MAVKNSITSMKISAQKLEKYSSLLFYLCIFRASLDPISEMFQIGGIGLGSLVSFLIMLLFFLSLIRTEFRGDKKVFILGLAFISLALISVFYSPISLESFKSFIVLPAYYSMFCITFYFCRNQLSLFSLFRVTIYSSFIPIVIGMSEIIGILKPSYAYSDRIFSTFYHPNALAFYLLIVIVCSGFMLKSRLFKIKNKERAFLLFIAFCSLILLLGTQTRSAWIGLFLIFFIYSILAEKRYLMHLAVFSVAALSLPPVQERLADLFMENENIEYFEAGNSFEWRQIVWEDSWQFIKNNPIFGHGYDTFSHYYPQFSRLNETHAFDAHNVYVQITFDMGFLGLLIYLGIAYGILKRLWQYRHIDPNGLAILIALVCAYLLVGYSDNLLFYLSFNWYFFLIIGGVFFSLPYIDSLNKSDEMITNVNSSK